MLGRLRRKIFDNVCKTNRLCLYFTCISNLSTVSIIVAVNLFDSMNDLKILASDMFI